MKRLQKENLELRRTIQKLKSGDHDIQLEGHFQNDMEWLLNQCQKKGSMLQKQIENQDASGRHIEIILERAN